MLQKNVVVYDGILVDIRTGDVLGPEVDDTYWKDKFYANFMVF